MPISDQVLAWLGANGLKAVVILGILVTVMLVALAWTFTPAVVWQGLRDLIALVVPKAPGA